MLVSDKRIKIIYTLGESPEEWNGEEGFIDLNMIDKYVVKPNELKHKVIIEFISFFLSSI